MIITKEKWRKMRSKSIFAVLALAIALTMTINVAFAAPPTARAASVITAADAACTIPSSNFAFGATVYVKLESVQPIGSNADLEVRDSSSGVVAGPWLNQVAGSVNSFVPASAGYYTVFVNGAPAWYIAVATFFVVPESMLGTLMATVAGFAAFATIGIVKRKHAKSK